MAKDIKLKKYEDVLMAALDFTEDDAEANARGEYSAAQLDKMKKQRTSQFAALFLIGVFAALFFIFGALVSSPLGMIVNILTGLILLLALTATTRSVSKIVRDMQNAPGVTEGRIQLDTSGKEDASGFVVRIEDQQFTVKKPVFLAFKNGDPYRLYYAPRQKKIVSAEWLRDDSPFENRTPVRHVRLEEIPDEVGEETESDTRRIISDDGELRYDQRG